MSGAEMKAHTAPKKKSYRERGKKINLITASHNKATTKRIQCPSPLSHPPSSPLNVSGLLNCLTTSGDYIQVPCPQSC